MTARKCIRELRKKLDNYLKDYGNIEKIKEFAESLQTSKIISIDLSTLHNYKPSDTSLDTGACFLLPPKYRDDYECYKSKEDGDCLFNSASIVLTGTEDLSIKLRLAVLRELIVHSKNYLSLDEFKKAITYSDRALDIGDSAPPEKKHEVRYFAQIREMCEVGAWCTLLAIYGLSSVLERPIESIFPPVRNSLYADTFSRTVRPRVPKNKDPIMILWTNISVTDEISASTFLDELAPSCNHFVPVLKKKKTIQSKRQISSVDNDNSSMIIKRRMYALKNSQKNE
ncbi:15236_t:CDS:2 [Acaulospora morrowiae]|uniref:Vertnin n=1 Tax=Acaulospora morrowiae TaxID=94023 RepID=A0A9N9BZK9_9GLOM|nr:15236_t:CDS:2 [Acaulospora morrowiae]